MPRWEASPPGYKHFREIALEIRKRSGCSKPREHTVANFLPSKRLYDTGKRALSIHGYNPTWLMPVDVKYWIFPPKPNGVFWRTGTGELSLTTTQAESLISAAVPYYSSLQTGWDAEKIRRNKINNLFPQREAYLRKVGYQAFNKEWWDGRLPGGVGYTSEVAIQRDIDNQILVKYLRTKNDFPGRPSIVVPEVKPPSSGFELKEDQSRSFVITWSKGWGPFWKGLVLSGPSWVTRAAMRKLSSGKVQIRLFGDQSEITMNVLWLNKTSVVLTKGFRYSRADVRIETAIKINSEIG